MEKKSWEWLRNCESRGDFYFREDLVVFRVLFCVLVFEVGRVS